MKLYVVVNLLLATRCRRLLGAQLAIYCVTYVKIIALAFVSSVYDWLAFTIIVSTIVRWLAS